MKILESWAEEEGVTDILLNGWGRCFVEKDGILSPRPSPFGGEAELWNWVEQLFLAVGRRFDARYPYLEGVWQGLRVHAVLPPIAPAGPLVSLRRPAKGTVSLEAFGVEWVPILHRWMEERRNLLVVGATGAGKTTLLARLLEGTSPDERIVVLEDTPELQLHHPHVVHLLCRHSGPEGVGEVTLTDLIRNALRMRPDRLLVGEVRGQEAWELLQALNTGHRGALCTLHGNSPDEALARLEALASLGGPLSGEGLRRWIVGSIDGVIFVERCGGQRRITSMVEVIGLEGARVRLQPAAKERGWGRGRSADGRGAG